MNIRFILIFDGASVYSPHSSIDVALGHFPGFPFILYDLCFSDYFFVGELVKEIKRLLSCLAFERSILFNTIKQVVYQSVFHLSLYNVLKE